MTRARSYVAGFAALALIDATTQVAFKKAALEMPALSIWICVAIAGYLAAFVVWMLLLKHAPVGPAFAASHLDIVIVLAVSMPLFGERLTGAQIAGSVCIVGGIVLLSISESQRAETTARDSLLAVVPGAPANPHRQPSADDRGGSTTV